MVEEFEGEFPFVHGFLILHWVGNIYVLIL
jgi:hypothetical protein